MKSGTLIKAVYDFMQSLDKEALSVAEIARIMREDVLAVKGSLNSLEKRGLIVRSKNRTSKGGKLYMKKQKEAIKINLSWLNKL